MILKSRNITCPHCTAMMEVTNPNLLSVRDVICPNPACKAVLHVRFDDGETILVEKKERKNVPGQLQCKGLAPLYLKEGTNSIGRADSRHTADLGFDVTDKAMSRLHCQIDVVRLSTGKLKATVCDMRDDEKIRIKPTIVDGEPLAKTDCIVLDDGDNIKMGNTVIKYVQE